MKLLRWWLMTILVLFCCGFTPVEQKCKHCKKRTHYNTLIDYAASGFSRDYAHPKCAGWNTVSKLWKFYD